MSTERDEALRSMMTSVVDGVAQNAIRLLMDAKLQHHLVLIVAKEPDAEHVVIRGDSSQTNDDLEALGALVQDTINDWLKRTDKQVVAFPDRMLEA